MWHGPARGLLKGVPGLNEDRSNSSEGIHMQMNKVRLWIVTNQSEHDECNKNAKSGDIIVICGTHDRINHKFSRKPGQLDQLYVENLINKQNTSEEQALALRLAERVWLCHVV